MDQLTEKMREMITNSELKISMTEVARVTGVSTSQLRYWEKKGYIKSAQDQQNKNHYFDLFTIFQAYTIKLFLDQGYTLTTAVQKEKERRESHQIFKTFITNGVRSVVQTGKDTGEVKLGTLAEMPTKEVYAVVRDGKTSLHLRTVKEDH